MRRAVLGSKDMELIRLYSDVPEFRQRLHREVIDETYPKLHELLRPLSQEDIDTVLCAWNGNIESKHAVVRYMKDHAREKDTAAWLAQEYGGSNSNSPVSYTHLLKELRASLETINKTSGTLISDIERHYKEICKERGIDPNAKKEPEMAVLDAEANQQEALFLIDDATYLHIQPCDSGWDYTLYDAASMKELDGGQLDMPELSCMKAVLQICDDNDLDSTSLRRAPLSMVETLQEAAYEQMQAEASQVTASAQLPEAQEQALDEYPMPDEQVSTPDMQELSLIHI